MNAVVAALQGNPRDTGFDMAGVQELTDYWADVRLRYANFDHGLKTPVTDIYRYEIPGGQYTNLELRSSLWALEAASWRSRRCTRRSTICWAIW